MNETNGTNAAIVELPAEHPLVALLDVEIAAVEQPGIRNMTQQAEVAAKFLREARTFARAGKVELCERRRAAAWGVLTGVKDDD